MCLSGWAERGIGFEDIVFHIERGDLLDRGDHPNPDRYAGQRMFVVLASRASGRGRQVQSDASYYSLLLVALIERGEPMTLADVAVRFAAAGIAPTPGEALASLKRCKPARAPVYRDGDQALAARRK